MRRTCIRKLGQALATAAVAELLALVVCGCGPAPMEPSSTATVTTSEVTSTMTAASTPIDPETDALLGELREIAANACFTVYYLGAEYQGAPIVRISADGESERLRVDIGYREPRQGAMLIVNIWEYSSSEMPEQEKPYANWELVSEVELDGRTDRLYRGPSAANILYYVTRRESTEAMLMGFTDKAGYMTEGQLVEIAPLLVPVR